MGKNHILAFDLYLMIQFWFFRFANDRVAIEFSTLWAAVRIRWRRFAGIRELPHLQPAGERHLQSRGRPRGLLRSEARPPQGKDRSNFVDGCMNEVKKRQGKHHMYFSCRMYLWEEHAIEKKRNTDIFDDHPCFSVVKSALEFVRWKRRLRPSVRPSVASSSSFGDFNEFGYSVQ